MSKQLFELLYENDDFVVVNKPPGLLSIPDRDGDEISLKNILKNKYGEIYTVHRLDKETSGIMVLGKTSRANRSLSRVGCGRLAPQSAG